MLATGGLTNVQNLIKPLVGPLRLRQTQNINALCACLLHVDQTIYPSNLPKAFPPHEGLSPGRFFKHFFFQ